MMKLIYEVVVNWADVNWLHTRILFAGKPEIVVGADPLEGWVRVFVKKKLIEYGDYSGSCIYRVKYDPASDTIILQQGTEERRLENTNDPEKYKIILKAFRDETRSSVEKVLLGE
jgi:hypothetical protein